MTAIEKVDFNGDTILTTRRDDVVYVAIKPIVDRLGLDWRSQQHRIDRDEVLSQGKVVMTLPSPGGSQDAICLPLQFLPGFLFGIETGRIPDPYVRAAALAYKRECHDALYRHFFGRQPEPDLDWSEVEPKIRMVRETRLTLGARQARTMWRMLGLPCFDEVPAPAAAPAEGMARYVSDFLDECAERDPVAECRAAMLYDAYMRWARTASAPLITSTGFGRYMAQLGAAKRKVNGGLIAYVGLRIKASS